MSSMLRRTHFGRSGSRSSLSTAALSRGGDRTLYVSLDVGDLAAIRFLLLGRRP